MSDETELDPEVARIARLAEEFIGGRTDLATAKGIEQDELEAVYQLGYNFYGTGRYADALDMFQFLCHLRHTDARYWFGLGASNQMLGNIALAVKAYGVSALLDSSDPQVPLRAAECFRQLGDEATARQALDAALIVADGNPKFAAYADRARVMLDAAPEKGERT